MNEKKSTLAAGCFYGWLRRQDFMKLFLWSDTWAWLAEHSGYHQVAKYIANRHLDTQIFTSKAGWLLRVIGKAYSLYQKWPTRNQIHSAAELFFRVKGHPKKHGILYHFLYFDSHHYFWEQWDKGPQNCIATIHHPVPRPVPPRMQANIGRLAFAIVLCHAAVPYVEKAIGPGHVQCILHGVDTEFFCPGPPPDSPNHWLFVGQNGRNTQMLQRVFCKLQAKYPELRLHCVVPPAQRHAPGLHELVGHPGVNWYSFISDEELRALYQKSYGLLMPLQDCSANNALVEALACGVPIVTTNVGGVPDYGGQGVFPVVQNNDDNGMIELIEAYVTQPNWRREISNKARQFAQDSLAWDKIAQQHLLVYQQFCDEFS